MSWKAIEPERKITSGTDGAMSRRFALSGSAPQWQTKPWTLEGDVFSDGLGLRLDDLHNADPSGLYNTDPSGLWPFVANQG